MCPNFLCVSCQKAVLNELDLGPNIARNTALSENVFMMVVCIELRIPLFVVGKPGSSKSLAKTVVADNMQGDAARSQLFKTFKQVIWPFQIHYNVISSFPKWRAIRIDVMGIRKRFVYLAVVDVLVTFNFELWLSWSWLSYYVDLIKTRYYNNFFPHQKVRMENSILSEKLDELFGDISQPFAIWSPSVLRASRSL